MRYIAAIILMVICFTLVYFLLRIEDGVYGITLLIALPLIAGFASGYFENVKGIILGLLLAFFAFCLLLMTMGLEGAICLIYIIPIETILMFTGWLASILFLKYQKRRAVTNRSTLRVIMLPMALIITSEILESAFFKLSESHAVTTSVYLPYSSKSVWDKIVQVDTLDSTKPLLLQLGLPVPQKCILEFDSVGAKRTCYFDGGVINENVISFRKPDSLCMIVSSCSLPINRWITFTKASYYFQEKNGGTELTRITEYKSSLRPRFYWNWLESISIQAEHQYVLDDLKKRLD